MKIFSELREKFLISILKDFEELYKKGKLKSKHHEIMLEHLLELYGLKIPKQM